MTPLEALHSATVKPAEFFGLENEMGQIKAGFLADAVLCLPTPWTTFATPAVLKPSFIKESSCREPI